MSLTETAAVAEAKTQPRTSTAASKNRSPPFSLVVSVLLLLVGQVVAGNNYHQNNNHHDNKKDDISQYCWGAMQGGEECYALEQVPFANDEEDVLDADVDVSNLGKVCLEIMETGDGDIQLEINFQAGSGWTMKDAHFWLGDSVDSAPHEKHLLRLHGSGGKLKMINTKVPAVSRFPFYTQLEKMSEPELRTTTHWNEVLAGNSHFLCDSENHHKKGHRAFSAQAVLQQISNPEVLITAFAAFKPEEKFRDYKHYFITCPCPGPEPEVKSIDVAEKSVEEDSSDPSKDSAVSEDGSSSKEASSDPSKDNKENEDTSSSMEEKDSKASSDGEDKSSEQDGKEGEDTTSEEEEDKGVSDDGEVEASSEENGETSSSTDGVEMKTSSDEEDTASFTDVEKEETPSSTDEEKEDTSSGDSGDNGEESLSSEEKDESPSQEEEASSSSSGDESTEDNVATNSASKEEEKEKNDSSSDDAEQEETGSSSEDETVEEAEVPKSSSDDKDKKEGDSSEEEEEEDVATKSMTNKDKEDEEWDEGKVGTVESHSSDSSSSDSDSEGSSYSSSNDSSSSNSSDEEDESPVWVKADELELTTSFIVVMPDQKHYIDMLLDVDTMHKAEEQIEASPELHEAWRLFVGQLMADSNILAVNASLAADHERTRDLKAAVQTKAVTVEWIEGSPDLFGFLITTPCPAHVMENARRGVDMGSSPKALVRGHHNDDSKATCYKAFGKYKVLHLNPNDVLEEEDEFPQGQSRQEVCYDIFHYTRQALSKEKLGRDLPDDVPFLIQGGKPESCLPTGVSTIVPKPPDMEVVEPSLDSADFGTKHSTSILYELRNDDGTWNGLRIMELLAYLSTTMVMMALCVTIYCFFLPKIDLESRNRVTDDWSQVSLRPQPVSRSKKHSKTETDYFPWLE